MTDFGFTPPPPTGDNIALPPREPATLNDLRLTLKMVDNALRVASKDTRHFMTVKDARDLLLDIRNVLDRMNSPTVLLGIAVELNDEIKAIKEAFHRDDSVA